jgi:hypothetical protein
MNDIFAGQYFRLNEKGVKGLDIAFVLDNGQRFKITDDVDVAESYKKGIMKVGISSKKCNSAVDIVLSEGKQSIECDGYEYQLDEHGNVVEGKADRDYFIKDKGFNELIRKVCSGGWKLREEADAYYHAVEQWLVEWENYDEKAGFLAKQEEEAAQEAEETEEENQE